MPVAAQTVASPDGAGGRAPDDAVLVVLVFGRLPVTAASRTPQPRAGRTDSGSTRHHLYVATEEPDRERGVPGQDAASAYRSSLRIELNDGTILVDSALDTLLPPPAAATSVRSGTALCVVTQWNDDEGWGVAEAGDVPGGCWMHFGVVEVPGYRTLRAGQTVIADWEEREQDGFRYRATRVSLPPAALM